MPISGLDLVEFGRFVTGKYWFLKNAQTLKPILVHERRQSIFPWNLTGKHFGHISKKGPVISDIRDR